MQGQLPTPRQLVFWAVVFEGGLGLLAIALGWWLGCRPMETVRWSTPAAIWGALAGLPMLVLFLP
ncbi:CPBP family intramembrane glutamate endopeptidase, partial [Planctomycetota bacterium]